MQQMVRKIFYVVALVLLNLCAKAQINGCTDSQAINYNPSATQNDGSCIYTSFSIDAKKTWLLPQVMNETSGLITFNEYMWTHNDHRDINIYRLDTADILIIDSFPLHNTTNTDWEEIAQDSLYIYVGDFGNNANGNRSDLHILRIEKQSFLTKQPLIDTIWFSYELQTNLAPSGPNNSDFDCEAMVVSHDSIYLFTKEWKRQSTTLYSLPKQPGMYTARFLDSLNVQGMITGATYMENNKFIALCGYTMFLQPFLYLLYDFHSHDFFSGNKRKIDINLPFHQVEAITTVNGLDVFISNEQFSQPFVSIDQQLHQLDLRQIIQHYLSSPHEQPSTFDNFTFYPNPFSRNFRIQSNVMARETSLTVYDVRGRVMMNEKNVPFPVTINTDDWAPGVYSVVVINDETMVTRKLIKGTH